VNNGRSFKRCSVENEWILFTSYVPGAGKTYYMKKYAECISGEGLAVAKGYINESRENIGDVNITNKRKNSYRVHVNVDRILEEHPRFVILDELMYFNNCTNHFLYEDASVLYKSGISVISSCNYYSFMSASEKFYHLSGVKARHLIPDRYLDEITKILFVDCDIDNIITMYESGKLFPERNRTLDKIYVSETLKTFRNEVIEELENCYGKKYKRIMREC